MWARCYVVLTSGPIIMLRNQLKIAPAETDVTDILCYTVASPGRLVMSFYILQCSDDSLTHWGRATHICVSKLTIIASDNGLAPGGRQAIIWNNAGILSIGLWGTNFSNFNRSSDIFFQENALEGVVCEMASILTRPQCVNLIGE